jgi:hypothetical protein
MRGLVQEVFMLRPQFLLAASLALVVLSAARADDQPAPLKFAWPVPSKATVTEKIWKHGRTCTTRYSVSVVKSGDDLKVHIDDFAFTEYGGKPADDPAVATEVARALPMAKIVPDLLLSADGRVKEVLGLDEMLKAEVELMVPGADEAKRAEQYKQLSTPEAREAIKRESSKNWRAWVGDWVGVVVPSGKGAEGRYAVRDFDGTERDAPATLQRAADETPGYVQLTRVATLEGDATKASLDAWIKLMTLRSGKAPPEGLFTGMVLTTRMLSVAEESTLRLKRAIREEACTVHRKDKDDLVIGVERHEFTFDWGKPAGDK